MSSEAFAPPIKEADLDKPAHLRTRRERQESGRSRRVHCPREAQAVQTPAADRRDAVQQLIDSSAVASSNWCRSATAA